MIGLILTKLERFQHFSTGQNSISTFFEKKIKFLGLHAVVLKKTFPLVYQLLMLTYCDEARVISFLEVRTVRLDRQDFEILI